LLCCEAAPTSLIRVRGTLIYEYIGEVVAEKTFRKRMQAYADEGIKHFYFMMLQKEEVGRVPITRFTLTTRRDTVLRSDSWLTRTVHRRDEEGRDRTICEPLV
jgi:hypothetical protein